MKNVYEQVKIFFEDNNEWPPIIKREWIEGFLRQKAWQGDDERNLKKYWRSLEMFLTYIAYSDIESLDNINKLEYSMLIEWISVRRPEYKTNVRTVKKFFALLNEFYHFLLSKKVAVGLTELSEATEKITGEGKVKFIKPAEVSDFSEAAQLNGGLGEDLIKLSGIVEKLMLNLGSYFQQDEFNDDFDRALYLYTGPFDRVPENEQDEFWLGFWDYFLFDYHLLANDASPISYFCRRNEKNLGPDEKQILTDLLGARFAVFYISKIINQDWVECTNLFNQEVFRLPFPEFNYKTLKRMLFFGHVFSQGMVMINYITSVTTSPVLRRRIRDEIMRRKRLFELQFPGAGIDDFFSRHALVVRHAINVLVTQARVNVTPVNQEYFNLPRPAGDDRPVNGEVTALLNQLLQDYGFSRFDIQLVNKLWHDYCQLTKVSVRKPGIWAAALVYTYGQINCLSNLNIEDLAGYFGVAAGSLYTSRHKLSTVLKLQKFDPRYLNEEGLILSLFAP